jgi:hypothetical protein
MVFKYLWSKSLWAGTEVPKNSAATIAYYQAVTKPDAPSVYA